MGESVTTSVLKFNGRAQRPPDSSCLWYDTQPPLGQLSDTGPGTHWMEMISRHSLGVTHTFPFGTIVWHWNRHPLDENLKLVPEE